MKIHKVNGVEVITCVHCSGSGVCKEARHRTIYRMREIGKKRVGAVYECSSCGSGLEGFDDTRSSLYKASPTRPTCSICQGRGFISV